MPTRNHPQITRRALLRNTAFIAGGGALTALLAACGATATPTVQPTATQASRPSAAASAAPATGGGITASSAPAASTATTAPASTAAPSAAASTASGKTIPELRVAVAGFPDSMDPHESISNVGMRVHYSTFDTLISEDQNGTFLKFYDARSGGGFIQPAPSPPCAAAEECHGPGTEAPELPCCMAQALRTRRV